jgi:hypothetical protein
MNSQSHAILTTVLLRLGSGERIIRLRHLNPVIMAGALLPDLPLLVFFIYFTFVDVHTQAQLWNDCYYYPGWQLAINLFHSFPLWGLLTATAFLLKRPRLGLFGLAGLLSSFEDLLLHSDDAHAHFWPISDYRFASPISYWDPEFHGAMASLGEIMAVVAASIWLWPRIETAWGRCLLILSVITLMGSHGIWSLVFGFL